MAIPSPGSGKAADVPADRHSLQMIRLNRLRGCPASPTVRFGFKLVRRELECWWLPRLVENRLLRDVGTEGQEEVPAGAGSQLVVGSVGSVLLTVMDRDPSDRKIRPGVWLATSYRLSALANSWKLLL